MATTSHVDHIFGARPGRSSSPAREALAARLADEGIELELPGRRRDRATTGCPSSTTRRCARSPSAAAPTCCSSARSRRSGGHRADGRPTCTERGFERAARPPRALAELPARSRRCSPRWSTRARSPRSPTGSLTGGFGEHPAAGGGGDARSRASCTCSPSDAHDEVAPRAGPARRDGVLDAAQFEWMTSRRARRRSSGPPAAGARRSRGRGVRARLRSWSAR